MAQSYPLDQEMKEAMVGNIQSVGRRRQRIKPGIAERCKIPLFYSILQYFLQASDIVLSLERGQITMIFEHDTIRIDMVMFVIQAGNRHPMRLRDLVPDLESFRQKNIYITAFAL